MTSRRPAGLPWFPFVDPSAETSQLTVTQEAQMLLAFATGGPSSRLDSWSTTTLRGQPDSDGNSMRQIRIFIPNKSFGRRKLHCCSNPLACPTRCFVPRKLLEVYPSESIRNLSSGSPIACANLKAFTVSVLFKFPAAFQFLTVCSLTPDAAATFVKPPNLAIAASKFLRASLAFLAIALVCIEIGN